MPERIAADLGIHPITLSNWLRKAAIGDDTKPATLSAESDELRTVSRSCSVYWRMSRVLLM